jgi:hypothetical protein
MEFVPGEQEIYKTLNQLQARNELEQEECPRRFRAARASLLSQGDLQKALRR